MPPFVGYIEVAPDVEPVQLNNTAPAGFRILAAVHAAAVEIGVRIQITCGNNGHIDTDPHTTGEAFDFRSHGFSMELKNKILEEIMVQLSEGGMDLPMPVSGGVGTMRFWGWLEHPGMADEHFHIQRRKGTIYPPQRVSGPGLVKA